MVRTVVVPRALHEVLGREQTRTELALVAVGGLGVGAAVAFAALPLLTQVPAWRAVPAVLIVLDLAAGCVANFTAGTDRHYAHDVHRRRVFLAVHVHLPVLALLLGVDVAWSTAVWACVVGSAAAVSATRPGPVQTALGGALTAAVVTGVVLTGPTRALVAAAVLFAVKLVLAFAVVHHGPAPVRAASGGR